MPKLKKSASKKAKRARVKSEMRKFKENKLHSSSKNGPLVKNRRQAIAISLNEAGLSRSKKNKSNKKK